MNVSFLRVRRVLKFLRVQIASENSEVFNTAAYLTGLAACYKLPSRINVYERLETRDSFMKEIYIDNYIIHRSAKYDMF